MSIDDRRRDWRGLVGGRISSWAARRCLLACGFCGILRAFGACWLLSLWASWRNRSVEGRKGHFFFEIRIENLGKKSWHFVIDKRH